GGGEPRLADVRPAAAWRTAGAPGCGGSAGPAVGAVAGQVEHLLTPGGGTPVGGEALAGRLQVVLAGGPLHGGKQVEQLTRATKAQVRIPCPQARESPRTPRGASSERCRTEQGRSEERR